jgi:hypothetical protein
MRLMASVIRRWTLVRARSAVDPARRAWPPRPIARASSLFKESSSPFALARRTEPNQLATALGDAGFSDVRAEVVAAPLRLSCADECVRFEKESFGALHQMLSGLDEAARDAAWTEIAASLKQFEGANGFEGPCELVVAAGTKVG